MKRRKVSHGLFPSNVLETVQVLGPLHNSEETLFTCEEAFLATLSDTSGETCSCLH